MKSSMSQKRKFKKKLLNRLKLLPTLMLVFQKKNKDKKKKLYKAQMIKNKYLLRVNRFMSNLSNHCKNNIFCRKKIELYNKN